MTVMRCDRVPIRAARTDEGYIKDTPVITRTGVFTYRDADGRESRELRLAEEVFHADSMAGLAGKPITNGHPGRVTSRTVRRNAIGTVLSAGRRDGDNLVADIVIHDPAAVDAGAKELSCGYECDIERKSGEYKGERYDAVQRNIRHNHLAVVAKGRAGNARLNLDGADAVGEEQISNEKTGDVMSKLRLDNGLEYDAAPEVIHAYDTLKQDSAKLGAEKDKESARADAAEKKLKDWEANAKKIKEDAYQAARARIELESVAKAHRIEIKTGAGDRDIREQVIKAIRGDADLSGKTDAYVEAAYDLAVTDAKQHADSVTEQRKTLETRNEREDGDMSAAEARRKMIKGE